MQKETMMGVICLGLFTAVVLSIYFIMKYRSVTPPRAANNDTEVKRKSDLQKPGIVVIGTGIGVLITGILDANRYYDNDAISLGIVAICAGIAMVVANKLDKKTSSED